MSRDTAELARIALSYSYEVLKVIEPIICSPKFAVCSGESKQNQHHYGKGGLAQHTLEVVTLCLNARNQFNGRDAFMPHYEIDEVELFFAALFHDVGKTYDYEPIPPVGNDEQNYECWTGTDHKRLIHHISRSAIMWSHAITPYEKLAEKYHDKVLHVILAHHTCREAGSPVAPKSRAAWLVTLCDNMSARMYDADSLDIVKGK